MTDDKRAFKQRVEELGAEQKTKQGEVCDFCGAPPGVWVYLARAATVVWQGDTVPMVFSPEWCACEHCHKLIQADDHEGLINRHNAVFRQSIMLKDLPPDALDWIETMRVGTRQVHNVFFDNWIRNVPPHRNQPENLRPN